jgi:hypothetical protein
MAVLPGFPGLEVQIVVNNAACKEYSEPDEEHGEDTSTTVTKYIEAKDGTQFHIRINMLPTFKYCKYDISSTVKVDGQTIAKPLWENEDPFAPRIVEGVESKTAGGWRRRNLVFANLTTGMFCCTLSLIHCSQCNRR